MTELYGKHVAEHGKALKALRMRLTTEQEAAMKKKGKKKAPAPKAKKGAPPPPTPAELIEAQLPPSPAPTLVIPRPAHTTAGLSLSQATAAVDRQSFLAPDSSAIWYRASAGCAVASGCRGERPA
jgi:hypothetical protein